MHGCFKAVDAKLHSHWPLNAHNLISSVICNGDAPLTRLDDAYSLAGAGLSSRDA